MALSENRKHPGTIKVSCLRIWNTTLGLEEVFEVLFTQDALTNDYLLSLESSLIPEQVQCSFNSSNEVLPLEELK